MLRRAEHERRLMNYAKCARARRERGRTGQYWELIFFRFPNFGHSSLLKCSRRTTLTGMSNNNEERSRYKITDSHRNQAIIATVRKDRDTYAWTWQGHIEFTDGQHFEFSSQRSFSTASEAEDYMRRFACARIDSQLSQ